VKASKQDKKRGRKAKSDLFGRAGIDLDIATWIALAPREQKQRFYRELKRHCLDKGYRDGWTACMFRERFGAWPSRSEEKAPPAAEVSGLVRGWLMERNRKYFALKRARERMMARGADNGGTGVRTE
jgi:hypothetical protein